jgi:hypothetical protein
MNLSGRGLRDRPFNFLVRKLEGGGVLWSLPLLEIFWTYKKSILFFKVFQQFIENYMVRLFSKLESVD